MNLPLPSSPGFSLLAALQATAGDGLFRGVAMAGMLDSVRDISEFFAGINSFTAKITAFTSFIGLSTVILFLAVMLFSAAVTMLGVPRGKGSFLLSLAVTDAIWFAWEFSFHPGRLDFFPGFLKSNAIILAPFLIVTVSAYLFPRAARLVARAAGALLKRGRPSFTKRDMLELFEEYQLVRSEMERNLLHDISRAGNDWVSLSEGTIRSARLLRKTMKRLSDRVGQAGADTEE